MTLKTARNIADTSLRNRISDADITMALFILNCRGRGVATKDAARTGNLRAEEATRRRAVAQRAA